MQKGAGRLGWKLMLLCDERNERSVAVEIADFGKVGAPHGLEDLGLNLATAKTILREVQTALAKLQESALYAAARSLTGPGMRVKDYRVRQFHTLFGRLCLKVPRLVDVDGKLASRQLLVPLQIFEMVRMCLCFGQNYPARPANC